jgi:tetratricopeptide (TPR) repeat protein
MLQRRFVGAVIIASTLAIASAARADSSTDEARAKFQQAEKAFNLGKFNEALAGYQDAYEAKPLPAFLFNIAQCYRNLANYERARFFYRRYLALEPRSPNRRLVEDLVVEMTRLMEKQRAATTATAPAVTPAPPAPEPAPPAAAATEPPPAVAVAPPPLPAPPVAAVAPAAEPPAALITTPGEPEAPSRPVYKRWWFWTGIGAVVAGGAVTAFLLTRNNGPQGSLSPIDGR